MKPTTLLFSLLSAISTSAIYALPSLAQTTSIPITGSVSATVLTSGLVSITSATVLSSIGTVSITGGQVSGVADTIGVPISVIGVGTNAIISGSTSGSVNFNDGSNASFLLAPTILNGTVTSISSGSSLSLFTPPSIDTSVSVNVTSGSISIPTSSIISPPTSSISPASSTTSIPVTGAVSVSVFASGGVAITFQSVLSSLGTISVTDGQITSFEGIQVAGSNLSVGDIIGVTGTSSGSISFNAGGSANFSNAPTSLTVSPTRVSGVIPYFGPVNPDQNFDATFNGAIEIPTSSIIGGNVGTSNSPISSIIDLNDEIARRVFSSQPVLESGKNFLPPSSLAGSRVHPDLISR